MRLSMRKMAGALAIALLPVPTLPAEPPGEGQAPARALADARLTFAAYLFDGERFPTCDFDQPEQMKGLIGPYTFQVTFHDRDFRPTETARAPGPYGAVVEMTSESGHVLHREATLFRTARPVAPGYCFDPAAPEELARWAGLDRTVVRQQAEVIARELKQRPFRDFSHDPRAARLLAGLSLAHKDEDAFVLERRWWADLKRKVADPGK